METRLYGTYPFRADDFPVGAIPTLRRRHRGALPRARNHRIWEDAWAKNPKSVLVHFPSTENASDIFRPDRRPDRRRVPACSGLFRLGRRQTNAAPVVNRLIPS